MNSLALSMKRAGGRPSDVNAGSRKNSAGQKKNVHESVVTSNQEGIGPILKANG
jgi:hypothetical protein